MDKEMYSLPIGKAEIVRNGDGVAILALGNTVSPALEAAQELAEKGIQATVINARFAKPLDSTLIIDIAHRIKYIVTIEENVLSGGFGSSVLSLIQKADVSDIHLKNIGIPDEFVEHGTQAILRAKYDLDAKGIARQTLLLLSKVKSNSEITTQPETKTTIF